ncbi:CD1871A family CXXC motif-containing protein [Angelakisella massiliensis]|nr:CD1871A family CXXC motif-containing protein [Angelakisella massiliensis]
MTPLRRNLPALVVFACGLVFFLIGITRGEADTVLTKAINLCLECIGVG